MWNIEWLVNNLNLNIASQSVHKRQKTTSLWVTKDEEVRREAQSIEFKGLTEWPEALIGLHSKDFVWSTSHLINWTFGDCLIWISNSQRMTSPHPTFASTRLVIRSRIFYPAIYFITITLEYKPKTEMQLHFVELSRSINHVKLVLYYALITLTVSTLKSGWWQFVKAQWHYRPTKISLLYILFSFRLVIWGLVCDNISNTFPAA